MKLKHIKIKPTIVKIKDLNNDAPYNGELFAEAMLTQIHLAKKTEPIPTWTTRRECLSHNRRIIKDLLAPRVSVSLIPKEFEIIIMQLSNDEYSSDSEMVDLLATETGYDKGKLARLVKDYRTRFMCEIVDIAECVSIIEDYI